MTNDDLKRFYGINAQPEQNKDFVRYDKNGRIQTEKPIENNDVVDFATLKKYAGGPGADINYLGAWEVGKSYKEYDLVYLDTETSRDFYLCLKDKISTISPSEDELDWSLFLSVPYDKPVYNNYDIVENDWAESLDTEDYKFKTTIQLTRLIKEDDVVSLINSDKLLFEKFGFGLINLTETTVDILSLTKPTQKISFKITIQNFKLEQNKE